MDVVNAYAGSGLNVAYGQFIAALGKGQDDESPHVINAMRDQVRAKINSLNNQDRNVVEKLRKVAVD
jgi:hypothetical protein